MENDFLQGFSHFCDKKLVGHLSRTYHYLFHQRMADMYHTIKIFNTFTQYMSTVIWYEFGVAQWKITVYKEPVLELLDCPSYTLAWHDQG